MQHNYLTTTAETKQRILRSSSTNYVSSFALAQNCVTYAGHMLKDKANIVCLANKDLIQQKTSFSIES